MTAILLVGGGWCFIIYVGVFSFAVRDYGLPGMAVQYGHSPCRTCVRDGSFFPCLARRNDTRRAFFFLHRDCGCCGAKCGSLLVHGGALCMDCAGGGHSRAGVAEVLSSEVVS